MAFNETFFKEETRCDFLVTEKRKKIWHAEIQLLIKLDEVCKKHHLTYFVEYGTLLGAVRHQGFIPWDDDIDVVMFRDDYEKFQEIAPREFSSPYFFQSSYTDLMLCAFSKIRDSRTTAIEFPDVEPEFNQGIFIDVFPYDDVPDNKNFSSNILDIQSEIWLTIIKPDEILQCLANGIQFTLSADILYDLLKLPVKQRLQQFEAFNLSHFGKSENVNLITTEIFHGTPSRKKEWYSDIIYLPFEYITVPAPAGYDQILTRIYGNYHVFAQNGSLHQGIFYDPDTPYSYYVDNRDNVPIPPASVF